MVACLPHLGHAAAHLAGQGAGVRALGEDATVVHGAGGPHVAGPVGVGPLAEVLGEVGHAKALVEEAAALLPVAEGIPGGLAIHADLEAFLRHRGDGG